MRHIGKIAELSRMGQVTEQRVMEALKTVIEPSRETDIVSLGKPIGNGLPLAGVVAPLDLVNAFCFRGSVF